MRLGKAAAACAVCLLPLLCLGEEQLDCSAKYKADGHEQTTAYVAESLGLGKADATRLKYFSQAPDDLALLYSAPAVGVWGVFWPTYRQRIVGTLHSLHGGDAAEVDKRRRQLASLISQLDVRDPQQQWKAGFLIHAFGDSYAHVYEQADKTEHSYSPLWGHIFDNREGAGQPDVIARHGLRYARYVTALCRAMAASAGNASLCTEQFGIGRACAVVQGHPQRAWHEGPEEAPADEPQRAAVYQEIEFGQVDAFLQRVKAWLDAPQEPVLRREDL